jgi:hypothetical protein
MKKQWFRSQKKRSANRRRLVTGGLLVMALLIVMEVAGQTQRGNLNSLALVYDIVPGGRYVFELINPPTAQGRAIGTVRIDGANAQVTSRWSDPYGRNSGATLTLPTYGWAPYSTPYMPRGGSVWTSSAAQGNTGYSQYQQSNGRAKFRAVQVTCYTGSSAVRVPDRALHITQGTDKVMLRLLKAPQGSLFGPRTALG